MKLIALLITALLVMDYDALAGASKKRGAMCGAGSGKCMTEMKHEIAVINTAGLKALIDAKTSFVLIDARSGKWDDGKRIPGAKTLDASASDEKIAEMLPDKSALIVTYCGGLKCPASNQLAERLAKMGYSNVIEYPEGIAGWMDKGHKVE